MGKEGQADYTIIKSNGKEVSVDMKSAIEEEKDIPAIYKPIFYRLNIKSMKIAIPALEVGDIIDYTIRSSIDWDMKENGVNFSPFIFSLSNNYPTMFQVYRFTMANGMKVKYRAFNGAPNIKFDPKASVYGDKNSYLSYYFLDKDREKTNEERWSYELRNTPTVKFQVVLLSLNDPESKNLGEATVDRSGLDIDNVYKRYIGAGMYVTPTVSALVGYTTEFVLKKKADGSIKNDDDAIRECYYCLRKVFLEMYYKGPVHSDLEKYITGKKLYKKVLAAEKKDGSQKEEKEDEVRISSLTFATAFRTSLAALKIPSEVFVYEPRTLGTWHDAIFMEELDYVIRVRSKRKFYYLEPFNNFDSFGTPYPELENAEGYALGYEEANSYLRSTIPPTTVNDNIEHQDIAISFSNDMSLVREERTSSYLGDEKQSHIAKANIERDYLNDDFTKYFNKPGQKKKSNESDILPSKYELSDRDEKIKERSDLFEKELKENFDVDKYEGFELIKDGRYGDTAWLQYKEKFTVKKMISKAGKNYIMDVGKLIGGQIKLEQNEISTRQTDIWVPYARKIENNISIAIPDGYTVEGLQDLNMNIDNESGSFISTAKIDGNTLFITTQKQYKKNFDKKEAWPNYVAFLEPAYKFSQARIVLKSKGK